MDRLDAVGVFVAVAEQGSFAAAARKLQKTPVSITRAITELESELNARLLNRTTRSVALTEAGRRYLERARDLIAANSEFEGAAQADAEPNGTLNICSPANFGIERLVPLIGPFLTRYPRVDARVVLDDDVVSLIDEGFDVAVRYGKLPDSTLRATKVYEARLSVYASPGYIARCGVPADPYELVRHGTISCSCLNTSVDRWTFAGPDGEYQAVVRPRLVVNTVEAAAEAAVDGLGLVYLASYQADKYVSSGQLIEVLSQYGVERVPFHLVRPAGRYTPNKVRTFINEVGRDLRNTIG